MDTLDTTNTIIIDLFHPNPEDLGPEGAEHDIMATSESGVNFTIFFKKKHRLYYCEDVEHETNILKWHEQDQVSQKNNLSLVDAQNLETILVCIKKQLNGPVQLILNGQGNLASDLNEQDTIAGYNCEDFIEIVDKFIDLFDLKNKQHPLYELVISSCSMAKSAVFVKDLTDTFQNFICPLEIILFKEMIAFSQNGEFTSFFEEGGFKMDKFNYFSRETTLSIFCPSYLKVAEKENLSPPLSPIKTVPNSAHIVLLQHPQLTSLKRVGASIIEGESSPKKAKVERTPPSSPFKKK